MKKIAFLFVLGSLSVSSCKKDYVCTCTTTNTVGNNTITVSTPYVLPDETPSQAATNCVGMEVYNQANSQTKTCKL